MRFKSGDPQSLRVSGRGGNLNKPLADTARTPEEQPAMPTLLPCATLEEVLHVNLCHSISVLPLSLLLFLGLVSLQLT